MNHGRALFSRSSLADFLGSRENEVYSEIDSLPDDQLMNTNPDQLAEYLHSQFSLDAPKIKGDEIAIDSGDTKVDVSNRFDYAVFDRTRPAYTDGMYFTFHIPFTGSPILFEYQPQRFTYNAPMAEVREHEVVIEFQGTDSDSERFKERFDALHLSIQRYLGWVGEDVQEFNSSIKQKARGRIEQRRKRIMKARQLGESFGFKLRRRDDAPMTFVVPVRKRELEMPTSGDSPWTPEPTLELDEYDNILEIIMNMSQVIERSPAAFQDMHEEHLRNHFLVQLNGQYEGGATGETFNFSGKSDILIRYEGKNLFVAECKFWDGQAALDDSIDQLLGYTTWRDTKTALLVFNKDRKLSTVLQAIKKSVPEHRSYNREEAYGGETAFRYIFDHPDDPDREITLTILVFEVPQ